MERTIYSNKIVSLHLEPCRRGCPVKDKCYLMQRATGNGSPLPLDFRREMLAQGFTVYEAICGDLSLEQLRLLVDYSNYHITISIKNLSIIMLNHLENYPNQVQISIYEEEDLKRFKGLKSFLLHDRSSYKIAKSMVKEHNATNLHFSIDRNWWMTKTVPVFFLQNEERGLSMDSCLTSWVINEECPYTTDYIDISHDWTVRRCPFEKEGVTIPKDLITNQNYIDLFDLPKPYGSCSYEEKLRRKTDG